MPNISSYSFVLPIYNEENRIPFHIHIAKQLQHFIVIDAGSTDNSLGLFIKDNSLSHVKIVTIPNPGSCVRSLEWYQTVIDLIPTNFFIIANCGHIYSNALLHELDELCSLGKYRAIKSRKSHFIYNQQDFTMGQVVKKYSLYDFIIKLGIQKDPIKRMAPTVYSKKIFDWNFFKIHNELPIKSEFKNDFCLSVQTISTFRDEDSASIEIKHAQYASKDAEYQCQKNSENISSFTLLFTYFKHFLFTWFVKGSISQGVPGFISAHYWASYHLSVKIRKWELQNGMSTSSILESNSLLRDYLLFR